MDWTKQYVGIPYKNKGRDFEGSDCWGLVRLYFKLEKGVELPSFEDSYDNAADLRIRELEAIVRESWVKVDTPQTGDLVEARVLGLPHVGIYIEGGFVLHAREPYHSVIERLDSPMWRHRVRGYYRYKELAVPVSVAALPHPLRTERFDTQFPPGTSLATIAQHIEETHQQQIPHNAVLMLDGKVIPCELWDKTVTLPGQRLDYRAVPRGGDGFIRLAAMLAIAVIAPQLALTTLGTTFGAFAATALGGVPAYLSAATAVFTIAGSLLINAIFPTRTEQKSNDPGSAQQQLLLSGGSNQAQQYGAVPVVLGRFRYSAPSGAIPYSESNTTTSYLRMLLVWGYGPLEISDLRIGDTPISSYEEVEYETLTGWDDTAEDLAHFNRLYGQDVSQQTFNNELISDGTDAGSPWTEHVITDECDRISVNLHFPEGLRRVVMEGGNAGAVGETYFKGQVQVRQIDKDTMLPLTSWAEINAVFNQRVVNLQPAWFNVDSDAELEPVYRWWRFSINENNNLIVRQGAYTTGANSEPSGTILLRQQQAAFGMGITYSRLPEYGPSEEPLWDVCMYGNTVYTTVDRRGTGSAGVTGCALSITGFQATIASGTINRAQVERINWGGSGQPFYMRKDAFSENISFDVPRGIHEVRVRRTNTSVSDFTLPSGNKAVRYHKAILMSITGYENRRPVVQPSGVKFAMTAIRIKATDQINGNVEGISATVQVICKDWDYLTSTWVVRPTRNPASLIRHVLQHPGNAQRVPDSQINLPELQDFHDFCRTNAFMYDNVLMQQKSVQDTLRDIAAAGRASPTQRDGKWTVIIDRPRTTIAQFFTPHNSWGFSGERRLPKMPHAWRVQFNNAEKGYQADEMIVYNDGYSAGNATLFEGLQLPGVTTRAAIFKHARFHFAQLKLRPEVYSLNADIEHLVCTRGDLVRVTHDVPMWGLGTGRIKSYLSSTELELDEEVPMDAGVNYTIRIRLEDGTSVTRTVVPALVDGYYSTITVGSALTATEGKVGNLFMFGSLSAESVELVVQSIEPAENMSARLTLVDYSPDVYTSDTETIPDFDSQITKPPKLLQPVITQVPTISSIVSNESVMVVLSPGIYGYRIRVTVTNPVTLPSTVSGIQGQIDYAGDTSLNWGTSEVFPVSGRSVTFSDVMEGEVYRLRLRYIDNVGRTGPWTTVVTHTVVGKTNPPMAVTGLSAAPDGTRLRLSWSENAEIDVVAYEVRSTNSDWGLDTGRLFFGAATTCVVDAPAIGVTGTWYVKAVDVTGRYSLLPTSVSFLPGAVPNTASLTYSIHDTSTTTATITLDWEDTAPQFGLKDYQITFGSTTVYSNASTLTLPANWIGNRTFTVKTRDLRGNLSSGRGLTVNKLLPNAPTAFAGTPNNGTLVLDWNDATKTTLPVAGYEVRTADTGWGGGGFLFKGTASTCTIISDYLVFGSNTFYVKTFDTDGYYSAAPATLVYNIVNPGNTVGVSYTFADTSLTNATVTIDWTDVAPPFGLETYEVSYDAVVKQVKASTITVPANWVGSKNFTIKTVDLLGNKSSGFVLQINKLAPNPATNFRAQVIDNNVLLFWTMPAKTTLPIQDAIIKKGATWATAVTVGTKAGAFTTLQELQAGTYTYWIAVRDTDNVQSTPISISAKVSEPPDFVFHGEFSSTFSGTKSSAKVSNGSVVMPINTTETWQQHFVNNGWASPSAQVSAGYPYYIQPGSTTGYYQEVFDFGTVLASSQVTVEYTGVVVAGAPVVAVQIETSDDNVNWDVISDSTSGFGTQFRYVRVRITVTGTATAIYELDSLNVRLDAKLKSDGGTLTAVSTDASGTVWNFEKEFVDVTSITVSASGTTALNPVYNFQDANISGTYSVTSNVATINATGHDLVVGQKVRLTFTTGSAPNGVYTVASVINANSFTVSVTTANTSGNVSMYPQGLRVYLFNSSGVRQTGTVSTAIKGY